jgi:flagellar basal-body rod protein FlgC
MSLFHLLSVSASGLEAQRRRAEVLTENLANAETTRTSQGGPYRRKDVIFQSAEAEQPFQSVFRSEIGGGVQGVRVAEVVEDQRPPEMRYLPGHPDADPQGYVAFPNINPAEDMVDLLSATRGYQSNIAAMSAVKDMIQRTLDLMR